MLTEQEAFDRVARHLISQNAHAVNSLNRCVYRSVEGLKCAVGCLIPDEEYNCSLEGANVLELEAEGIMPPSLRGLSTSFLCTLQDVHDENPTRDWPSELQLVAKGCGMNTDVLEEAVRAKRALSQNQ